MIGKKKIACLVLACCVLVGSVTAAGIAAYAADDRTQENLIDSAQVLAKQQRSRTCTLASASMMIKRASVLKGDSSWESIDEYDVGKTAWLKGEGLLHEFTYRGMEVSYSDFTGENNKNELIKLLSAHPEGVVLYERSKPHAVLITDYDFSEDIFYCADPAKIAARIPLEDSTLGNGRAGGNDQDVIVKNADCYWIIKTDLDIGTKSESVTEYLAEIDAEIQKLQEEKVNYDIDAEFVYYSPESAAVAEGKSDFVHFGEYMTFSDYRDVLPKNSYLDKKQVFRGWKIQRQSDGMWAVNSEERWMSSSAVQSENADVRIFADGYILNFDENWLSQTDEDETYFVYAVWE